MMNFDRGFNIGRFFVAWIIILKAYQQRQGEGLMNDIYIVGMFITFLVGYVIGVCVGFKEGKQC